MKINAIRIKNLASLEGTTEIDFTSEPLASAGIFAITGATGAGKSTLLDALCLALYGKTPRYLQAKEMGIEIHDVQGSTMSQGDVRGILRDGTSEGFAEVDFIGTDGQNYCSTWSVRRARNKAEGSLQADNIQLKNISTNLDIPGKKVETYKEIERLVGLNFEQFTRSVLLAQGDFTAFMKANKDEKSSLLEKLTGTQIYSEISKRIFENYKTEEQALRELNIRREGIVTLSDEEVTEIRSQEVILLGQINQITLEIENLTKEIHWHEQFTQLSNSKEIANENLQKANLLNLESEERKQQLMQVELAQTTRSWNDSLLYNQKQLVEQNSSLAILKTKITALHSQREDLEKQHNKEELNFIEVNQIQKDALPKLAKAKEFDTLLVEKAKQKVVAKTDEESGKFKQINLQKQVLEKENEVAKLNLQIKNNQEWQVKYDTKKTIAAHKDLITSKLSDADKLVVSQKNIGNEKAELEKKKANTVLEINTLTSQFKLLETDCNTQQKVIDKQSAALLLVPIEQLLLDKDRTERLLHSTLEGQSIWNIFHNLNSDFQSLIQKQANDQVALSQKTHMLQQHKTQLELDYIAKITSEKLLQKARLSASVNVEEIRSTLSDNEPCPVCGSVEHPYVLHNPQLEKVWSTLEELHEQNEKVYLLNFGANSSLEQEVKGFLALIEKQELEIARKRVLVENKQTEWNLNPISIDCQDIDVEQKTIWIAEKVERLKTEQLEFQLKVIAHSDQKRQLEKGKELLEQLKENRETCYKKGESLKSQLAITNEKLETLAKDLSQVSIALTEIQNQLAVYFTATDWMEKWLEKPSDFVQSILNFANEWNTKSEHLEKDKNQHLLAIATLEQLKSQEKSLGEELLQKSNVLKLVEDQFTQLKLERTAIYEGIAVEIMEENLSKAVDDSQKKLEEIKINLQQHKIEIATAETSDKEISSIISKIILEVENSKEKIQNWVNSYNEKFQQSLTVLDLNELLNFTSEWIETERKALSNLEEERTKSASVLFERSQKLEEHISKKPSERALEDLKIVFEKAKIENDAFTQQKATIGFKLKEDEVNKHKIGDLLKEISAQFKVYENWSKLNEIIGSADGKKFRQIAQEHTLEVLLSYANIHLKVLTNRYKIERIPNTLGLQVVDLDMGDEIRTVYSLSGGESFLVSLALALGLASLSSSKLKVESLFIDEGFGSLDPNTLNVAMDALERLHNQGRKVGVISHVQEMTERIPVQIKVSKKASGRSKVEVVGI